MATGRFPYAPVHGLIPTHTWLTLTEFKDLKLVERYVGGTLEGLKEGIGGRNDILLYTYMKLKVKEY